MTIIRAFKGAHVPMHIKGSKITISFWSNVQAKQVMFTMYHGGPTALVRQGEGWEPVTVTLPAATDPQPGIEDGIVRDLDQLMLALHPEHTVVC